MANDIFEVAKDVVGVRPRRKLNDWFDGECEAAVEVKYIARGRLLQCYTRTSREDYRLK